jgi:hypothetical protein
MKPSSFSEGGEKQRLLGPFGPACAGNLPFGKPSLVKPRKAIFPNGSLRRLNPFGGLQGYISLTGALKGIALKGYSPSREPCSPFFFWFGKTKKTIGGSIMKKRVVVELTIEEFEKLALLKKIVGLEWKDFLLSGAVYVMKELNIEEELRRIREMIINQKNNTEEV